MKKESSLEKLLLCLMKYDDTSTFSDSSEHELPSTESQSLSSRFHLQYPKLAQQHRNTGQKIPLGLSGRWVVK